MTSVLLGLGSNQDDPLQRLEEAVRRLEEVVAVDAVSSVYRTEPVGYATQPDFLNVVLAARTERGAGELLEAVLEVEREMGRARSFRNAPRVIDIDLLAYGDRVMSTERLTLPHAELARRGFVLHPLAEVAPEWRHPVLGVTARELLLRAVKLERVERIGVLPRGR